MKALSLQTFRCVFLTVVVIAGTVIGGGLFFRLSRPATVLPAESLVVRGEVRQYRLAIPPSREGRMPAPVLLVFHGAIDTTEQAAEYTQLDRLASSQGVYVVYPQGRFLNWPPSIPPENPECIEPDLAFFDALCRELTHRYPVDTKRIYVTGMSQGAAFVNLLVAKRSERSRRRRRIPAGCPTRWVTNHFTPAGNVPCCSSPAPKTGRFPRLPFAKRTTASGGRAIPRNSC